MCGQHNQPISMCYTVLTQSVTKGEHCKQNTKYESQVQTH